MLAGMKRTLKFFLTVLLLSSASTAYSYDWKFSSQVNFGLSANVFLAKGQNFPGIRFFAGASTTGYCADHFMVNYGLSLALYYKSIGNSLNPLIRDIQLDITNSVDIGVAGDPNEYEVYVRTLGNSPYYNMSFNKDWGVFMGTNFIFNSNHRHQTVGTVGVLSKYVSAVYYNDGAPPFSWFGLGDCSDRWWTGGGCMSIHSDKGFNYVEFGFDQFTGYSPLLYELAGVLGINTPSYDKGGAHVTDDGQDNAKTFNSSVYFVRVFPEAGYSIDIGLAGALRLGDRYFAVQDMIHIGTHDPLHPNHDRTRFVLGGTYVNMNPNLF